MLEKFEFLNSETISSAVSMDGFGSTSSNRTKSFNPKYSIQFLDTHPFDEIINGFIGNLNCLAEFLPKIIFLRIRVVKWRRIKVIL